MASRTMQVMDANNEPALEIAFVTDFELMWKDSGSGADVDVSFWYPNSSDLFDNGFRTLGHYGKVGHDQPSSAMLVARAIQPDALKEPERYEWVWDDAGSGADSDVSIWKPIAPSGYSALGTFVWNRHVSAEELNVRLQSIGWAMACVRNDLVTGARVGEAIWNDAGSGADHDVNTWQISPLSPSPSSNVTYITSGSFIADSDNKLTYSPVANALAVQFPIERTGTQATPPELTSMAPPDEKTMVRDANGKPIPFSTSYLSCVQVNDDRYVNNLKRQVAETPFYTLEKFAIYKVASFHTNSSNDSGTFNFTYTTGMSETDTQSISHTAGIEVTVGVEGSVGAGTVTVSASTTVSYSLGITNELSTTLSTETSHSVEYTIPAKGAGCLFTLSYLFVLKRGDGSEVRSWVANSGHTHYSSYSSIS
ncbi:MAG: Vps62-related protein [Caldilineales bacterium]|nr:Vps62-related protein [Caldilineales bacterium]